MAASTLKDRLRKTEESYHQEQKERERNHHDSRSFAARMHIGYRHSGASVDHVGAMIAHTSEENVLHFEALRARYPKLEKLVLSPDAAHTSIGGHVLVFSPEETLQLAHAVNSKSPFGLTMAIRVKNMTYTTGKELRARVADKTYEYISTLDTEGPRLSTHWRAGSAEDAARWPVFFPAKRAHVGIYHTPSKEVYMIIRTHAGANAVADVKEVLKEPDMTASKFVEEPRIKWLHHMAYRNAARVLHGLANALGFKTDQQYDPDSHSGDAGWRKYIMSKPAIAFYHNTQRVTHTMGQARPIFFRDVVDATSCEGGEALVHSDITMGYTRVPSSTFRGEFSMIPMTTGKVKKEERREMTSDDYEDATDRVVSIRPRANLFRRYKYTPFSQYQPPRMNPAFEVPPEWKAEFTPAYVVRA